MGIVAAIDLILVRREDQMIRIPFVLHHLIEDVILLNYPIGIKNGIVSDVNVLPANGVLVHEVIPNHLSPTIALIVEGKVTEIFINPEVDLTKTIKRMMAREMVLQQTVNVDFIQSIKSIYSM
jgi:hypothetical protein